MLDHHALTYYGLYGLYKPARQDEIFMQGYCVGNKCTAFCLKLQSDSAYSATSCSYICHAELQIQFVGSLTTRPEILAKSHLGMIARQ